MNPIKTEPVDHGRDQNNNSLQGPRMKLWKSLAVGGLILGLTAGAVAYMASQGEEPEVIAETEPFWNVRSVTREAGNFHPQIELIGRLTPLDEVTESAQIGGRVLAVPAQAGMRVTQGTPLVTLDDFDVQLRLQQAQADLAEFRANRALQEADMSLEADALAVEKAELERLKNQLAGQRKIANAAQAIADLEQQVQRQTLAVAQRELALNNHSARRQQWQAQETRLKLALQSAERAVDNASLVAPFDARIAEVLVKPGQLVNPGQPLFRLYREQSMAIEVSLPTYLGNDAELLNGRVYDAQRASDAVMHHHEAQLKAGEVGFKAWFQLQSPEAWLPGDVARLRLNLPAQANTYRVPAGAVFQDRFVYQIDANQTLKALPVQVLGANRQGDENALVIRAETSEPLRLMTTRLANPSTGMKVYEAGVDPEPVAAEPEKEIVDEESDTTDEEGQDDNA